MNDISSSIRNAYMAIPTSNVTSRTVTIRALIPNSSTTMWNSFSFFTITICNKA